MQLKWSHHRLNFINLHENAKLFWIVVRHARILAPKQLGNNYFIEFYLPRNIKRPAIHWHNWKNSQTIDATDVLATGNRTPLSQMHKSSADGSACVCNILGIVDCKEVNDVCRAFVLISSLCVYLFALQIAPTCGHFSSQRRTSWKRFHEKHTTTLTTPVVPVNIRKLWSTREKDHAFRFMCVALLFAEWQTKCARVSTKIKVNTV